MVRSAGLQKAISEAIWGMVIADAIAMPVHWFYQIDEIKRRYNGWIQGTCFERDCFKLNFISNSSIWILVTLITLILLLSWFLTEIFIIYQCHH